MAREPKPGWRVWLCIGFAVAGLLALAPAASAGTFTVNSTNDFADATPGDGNCADGTGHCTLRAAIDEANFAAAQDTVNLPPGTYSLGALGQLLVSSNIVIEGTGNASNTTVRQAQPGRVIEVDSAGALDLRDATVRDGVLAADGGGVRTQGTLTLRRAVVANNEANNANGGGIAILSPASGNTTILDSKIGSPGATPDNRAGGPGSVQALGGGIYHEAGTLTIRNSTITNNRVDAGAGTASIVSGGGGIYSQGRLVIEDSRIESNLATGNGTGGSVDGGGVRKEVAAFALTMRRTTVADNEAAATGTTTDSVGGVENTGPGLIEDSTFTGNASNATDGNGIGHSGFGTDTLTVRRSTIAENQTGGVSAFNPLILENSTVSGNGSGAGVLAGFGTSVTVRSSTIAGHGGEGLVASGSSSNITVKGSILDGNNPDCATPASGTIVSGGGNVENGNDCATFFTAASDQLNTDPLLGPLQNNGGPTKTRAIAGSSPARDAVPAGLCPPPATDQRGVARPQGSACDSGAFEIAVAPPPGGGGGGGTLAAPVLDLSGKKKQKAKKLKVEVGCGAVACSVDLAGKAKVPRRAAKAAAKTKKFELKPNSLDVAAGATETVRLKFKKNKKTVRKVKRLLKQGGKRARKRAKVLVDATATNPGGTDTATRKIKLRG